MSNLTYQEKMKILRGKVTFDYDLRKKLHTNSIKKIELYFNEFQALANLPNVKKYKAKSASKNKIAKEASLLNLPQFKFSYFADPYKDLKVEVNKTVVLKSKYAKKTFYPFNQKEFAKDPDKEIDRVLALIKEPEIIIYTGDYYYRRSSDKEYIKNTLLRLINSYHNYKDFLKGLCGVKTSGDLSIPNFIKETENYKKIKSETKYKNKRKSKYAKAKGR